MQTGMTRGYGQWVQGQDEAVLDQWPGQELYRAMEAEQPRPWAQIWSEAGGEIFDGRMIALKNDPIWTRISRFGLPYPPFDYGSRMDIRDVDRDTCIELGLIDRDTVIPPQTRDFNSDLKVSPQIRAASLRTVLEEDGYVFDGDVLEWREAA
jgi:hypothetical protein